MLQDCVQIFKQKLDDEKQLILDNYIPKDGTYIMVLMDGDEFLLQEPLNIINNKKTGEITGRSDSRFKYFCYLDYNSRLVEMNKPIDPKKVLHSGNYLSFFIKKESLNSKKLTGEIIETYYSILKDPYIKYEKKPKTKQLYKLVEDELGQPDKKLIDRIHNWIGDNINEIDIDLSGKDYLKLFFVLQDEEETKALYQREAKRYLIPNIYNNNDSNTNFHGVLYGLPNNNMGMNAKKPYLEHKTRKVKEPNLIPLDDVLLQDEFFNYLLSFAAEGKYNVYVDTIENEFKFLKNGEFNKDFQSGYFFRMQKEKNEVAITDFDTISYYQYGLSQIFYYKQIISCPTLSIENLEAAGVKYGAQRTMSEIQHTIDEVFFGKRLINNYFTNSEDLSIQDSVVKFSLITSRNRLFSWFYKGDNTGIEHLLEHVSLDLIRNCIAQGYDNKARHQLNLRWSFIDYFSQSDKMEVIMSEVRQELRKHINLKEDWEFSGDKEYYYAVGQVVYYLLNKIKAKNRPQSLVNPFLNSKKDALVKKKLMYLYKQVNYDPDFDLNRTRVKNLIGHIITYQKADKVDQEMLLGGFAENSLFYEKAEETAK